MAGFFKPCTHPFDRLGVEEHATSEIKDEDFEHITYHLICRKCNKRLPLKYTKLIGGVEAFLDRHKL